MVCIYIFIIIFSKQGLLSHEFYTPGVYYYSDQNFQEAAEYIGTIIVKPKQKEHYVDLTEKGFTQGKRFFNKVELGAYSTNFIDIYSVEYYSLACIALTIILQLFYKNQSFALYSPNQPVTKAT